MSEATEGCAILEDVDEDTFVLFSQFAYTGDYTVLKSTILPDDPAKVAGRSPSPPGPRNAMNDKAAIKNSLVINDLVNVEDTLAFDRTVDHIDDECGSMGLSALRRARRDKKKSAMHLETEPKTMIEEKKIGDVLWKDFRARSYLSPDTSYTITEVDPKDFLAHARIYVFADTYDICPLRKLSLDKLQRLLVVYSLSADGVNDIIRLLHWTYLNTRDGSSGSDVDELRSLTAHYAACEIARLAKHEEFEALLEEQGALGKDVIKMLLKGLGL